MVEKGWVKQSEFVVQRAIRAKTDAVDILGYALPFTNFLQIVGYARLRPAYTDCTKKVLPTRLRPITDTSSDSSVSNNALRVAMSFSLPTITISDVFIIARFKRKI